MRILSVLVAFLWVTACSQSQESPSDSSLDAHVFLDSAQVDSSRSDVGNDASASYDVGPATDAFVCGTQCPQPQTHWNPYTQTCVVDTSIDPPSDQPVCGCDGANYPNAAVAARRGVRLSTQGVCGDILTPCGERECTSSEVCTVVDCRGGGDGQCVPKPSSCEEPTTPAWLCGCDDNWYIDRCHLSLGGQSEQFESRECGPIPATASAKRFFVSRFEARGNFGGVAMADQRCALEAQVAGLRGTWKAFLADETQSLSRVVGQNRTWSDMSGALVFASPEALLRLEISFDYRDGNPRRHADGTESTSTSEQFWLGFDPTHQTRSHCQSWSSLEASGFYGFFQTWGEGHTQIRWNSTGCAYYPESSFLCFEQ